LGFCKLRSGPNQKLKVNDRVKSGGQECPPHNISAHIERAYDY